MSSQESSKIRKDTIKRTQKNGDILTNEKIFRSGAPPVKLPAKIWETPLCMFPSFFLASWRAIFRNRSLGSKQQKSRITSWLLPYPQVAHLNPTLPAMSILCWPPFYKIGLMNQFSRQKTRNYADSLLPSPWADEQKLTSEKGAENRRSDSLIRWWKRNIFSLMSIQQDFSFEALVP